MHGDLKGVRLRQSEPFILPSSFVQANILIDKTRHARLADFGLLTIVRSDPANCLSSTSHTHGGTARWISPELIDTHQSGFKNGCPTKSSNCYALGMVIYETISGRLPFHEDADLTVLVKVLNGRRPPQDACFTGSLWKMLERCWKSQPDARPSIEDVLRCLEMEVEISPRELDAKPNDDDDNWSPVSDSSGKPTSSPPQSFVASVLTWTQG